MLTKEEFLIESIQYYIKDPKERRNLDLKGNCRYSPQNNISEGCIVGRYMNLKDAKYIDNIEDTMEVAELKLEYPNYFPEKLKHFDMSFLMKCQNLHDDSSYWDENGLTSRGLFELQDICYELEESTFEKCISVN